MVASCSYCAVEHRGPASMQHFRSLGDECKFHALIFIMYLKLLSLTLKFSVFWVKAHGIYGKTLNLKLSRSFPCSVDCFPSIGYTEILSNAVALGNGTLRGGLSLSLKVSWGDQCSYKRSSGGLSEPVIYVWRCKKLVNSKRHPLEVEHAGCTSTHMCNPLNSRK